jgi:hypothetical protein
MSLFVLLCVKSQRLKEKEKEKEKEKNEEYQL